MQNDFRPRCVSIDLEVNPEDRRIRRFAAVRGDTGKALVHRGGNLAQALARLDQFSEGAAFLLGHNLVAFDAPILEAQKPSMRLLGLPRVDTLRLNPLAFPRNPYHRLVKHYQDGQLKRGRLNDPELDARLALEVFGDQQRVLREAPAELLVAWHWLTTQDGAGSGLDAFFATVRRRARPSENEARAAIAERLEGQACMTSAVKALEEAGKLGWPLAYALAWLSVAGGNSVMPPWVRHQFPDAGVLVRALRDTPCGEAGCAWCRERHDAVRELRRWFGHEAYRPEPPAEDGRPMQQAIVEAAMRGESVLGILPTGTGKSVCYQVPALSRYEKTGALTVVISPLVALMADQVAGLQRQGIASCAAVNGLLSMPERADVLDRVRLGDVAILIVAPEQLRSRMVRRVLDQREIGAWVLDEAHCLSKWGHAFRPDYRYVGRFIRERARGGTIPPVLCLTATAKPDVVEDITAYFHKELRVQLSVFNGGSRRDNLEFDVVPTSPDHKWPDVHQLLDYYLPRGTRGGAIVYCATRKGAEDVARFLKAKEEPAGYFHGGLPPETKKDVQERFIRGELRVIAATNAFGMGIDKPDVRLVIHADVPGSLENYLQEAGRAGRDRRVARCVLLYTAEDVERQFGMSAGSRLTAREIDRVLRALRRLDRRKRLGGEVVATAGEILAEDEDETRRRDAATDDTRVRTAVAWLEDATLLTREENQVQVFPSSLRVSTVEEARERLEKRPMRADYREKLLKVVEALIDSDPKAGLSTDQLMGIAGLTSEEVRRALFDLEEVGIASNDTALTAYVHQGVERSSHKRLERAAGLEVALLRKLRELAPDLAKGEASALQLRTTCQALKDEGHPDALPERLWSILRGLAGDGRDEQGGVGSVSLRRLDAETVRVVLQREWSAIERTAELRRAAASRLLDHLLACVAGQRGTDLLAETTLGKLREALDGDALLKGQLKDPVKALERALLWLHEQEISRLNKGLAVFRSAMTIKLLPDKRRFDRADYEPLKLHYDEQVVQIHVMAEYVQRGLEDIADALRLAMDYFSLKRDAFLQRWLPDREKELSRQTTPESWRAIVESLNNRAQERIVTDDREATNVLVLAGPGSGKTRVLVHRIAYLIRAKREEARGILALAYNRHAAVEIRRRLAALIGEDAKGVTVLTCHALAMRLAGLSFVRRAQKVDDDLLRTVIPQTLALLKGEGLPPDEADDQRDRLLAGFRWILVDEYQDIDADQYELIAALAGRTLDDPERKLTMFAVGDDDQNIYAFNGASVEFIRRFERDYASKPSYLTENYRSTRHIVEAGNLVIAPARGRMKSEHPIRVDRARTKAPPGGEWEQRDPVARGRVQILPAGTNAMTQAVAVMIELQRLARLDHDWSWARAAIIARDWKLLEPVDAYCELHGIPVQRADEEPPNFWRLRETQALVDWSRGQKLVSAASMGEWLGSQPQNTWLTLLQEAAADYTVDTGSSEMPSEHFIEWLAEWGREVRRRQTGLLLLTAHRAKGLEFDHVAVLHGDWQRLNKAEDPDAPRRLLYVAMTRARQTLTLARMNRKDVLLDALPESPAILRRAFADLPAPDPQLRRVHQRLGLRDVDLGFAGRSESHTPVHRAIAGLSVGSALKVTRERERWFLHDQKGVRVGRLSESYEAPKGMQCVSAKVTAIVIWRKSDSTPEYQHLGRCERWEVVVPELAFAPISD